jgi:hypothetical protein
VTDMRNSLVSFLKSHGWEAPKQPGPEGGLWRKEGSRFAVPVPRKLDDHGPEWELVLDRVGLVEGLPAPDVGRRIRGRLLDVANLRAAKDVVIEDSIPFGAGASMMRESWLMLRSCATTSLGARPHIAGNYRKTGDEIVELARMAHTRKGSFIIPIFMPITEPDEQPDQIAGMETAPPEPYERRVMRTFAESLSIVESVVEAEREPKADDLQDMIRAGVSHEFTAGLHRILKNDSVAEFTADFEWASGAGPVPSTPRRIGISAEAGPRVERVSRRLRSEKSTRGVEMLTGPIVAVQRDDEDTGGVVTIQTVRGARPCHVSVNVSRKRLDQALDWMKQRSTALVTGHVRHAGPTLFSDSRDGIGLLAHEQLYSEDD